MFWKESVLKPLGMILEKIMYYHETIGISRQIHNAIYPDFVSSIEQKQVTKSEQTVL